MEPVFGRFSALSQPPAGFSEGCIQPPLLFARLLNATTLQLLYSTTAYIADLSPTCTHPIRIRHSTDMPSLELLALLLAIPTTTGCLQPATREGGIDKFVLRCTDRLGLELEIAMVVEEVAVAPLLKELFEGLFAAVVGLEAVVREMGGEKGGDVDGQGVGLESVKDGVLPLLVRGAKLEDGGGFRRASAAEIGSIGRRAFVAAHAAWGVRHGVLEQRRMRKEAERERKRRVLERVEEGRRLREAGAVGGKMKRSFWEDEEAGEVAGGNGNGKGKERGKGHGVAGRREHHVERKGEGTQSEGITGKDGEVEVGVVMEDVSIPVESQTQRQKPPAKKKRKKRRLV